MEIHIIKIINLDFIDLFFNLYDCNLIIKGTKINENTKT